MHIFSEIRCSKKSRKISMIKQKDAWLWKHRGFTLVKALFLTLCRSECQWWKLECGSWLWTMNNLCDEVVASHLWGFLFNDASIKTQTNRRVTIVCPNIFLDHSFLPATGTSLWKHQTETMECQVSDPQERTCMTELYIYVLQYYTEILASKVRHLNHEHAALQFGTALFEF